MCARSSAPFIWIHTLVELGAQHTHAAAVQHNARARAHTLRTPKHEGLYHYGRRCDRRAPSTTAHVRNRTTQSVVDKWRGNNHQEVFREALGQMRARPPVGLATCVILPRPSLRRLFRRGLRGSRLFRIMPATALLRGVRDSLRSSISHHSPFCFPRTTNGDDATTPVLLWSVSGICIKPINSSVFLPRGSGHVRSRSPETPPPSSHDRTGTGLCVL